MTQFLNGLNFYFLPLGFGAKRLEFLKNQVEKFGGTVSRDQSNFTHVVIDDSVAGAKNSCLAAFKLHGIKLENGRDIACVNVKWLCKCFTEKVLVDAKPYEITWIKKYCATLVENESVERQRREDCEKVNGKVECEIEPVEKKSKIDHQSYLCSQPSSSSSKEMSATKKIIIEELEKMSKAYAVRNDTWRSHGYRKAITAIMSYDKEISNFQTACSIPGVGEKMALKIMEIIENGKLQKVEEILDEKTKTLDVFCKIWGVGPSTAEGWYVQGLRTLEDLERRGKLTKQQKIGLKLYDDLLKRIPREEVEEIGELVRKETTRFHSSLSVEIVGSYRRGKDSCGDVDLMIVNSGPKTPFEILTEVTDGLRTRGLLTDDLVNLEEDPEDENHHRKYFGIFKLPGENRIHRRIDLFVVPKSEYATALFHYTGSALFNRSIKLLAAKKDMTLTEHGLYLGTIRKGSEVKNKGQLISTPAEEDIFRELDLPYRLPRERDH